MHPALASIILFRFLPSEPVVLLVGIPLTKCCSLPLLLALDTGADRTDELGDLGTSLRRGLVGVDGPAAAAGGATEVAEMAGGLLTRPLPVFTGVPDIIAESPSRLTRRDFEVVDTGTASVAGAVGAVSASAFCGTSLWELVDAFFSACLVPERARERPLSASCLGASSPSEGAGVGRSPSYSTIRSSFQVTLLRDFDAVLRLPELLRSAWL